MTTLCWFSYDHSFCEQTVRKFELKDPTMQTDEALIERIAGQDETAFESLVSRYETRLYNFALRMLGNETEAEDALQETFLKVFRYSNRFNPRYRASTWIYAIMRNGCLDRLKKKSRTVEVSLQQPSVAGGDDGLTLEDNLAADCPGPDQQVAQDELAQRVRSAVNRLPEGQRTVVILKEYQQLTCEEISEVVGCPIGTVKSRLHYAMETLRTQLGSLAKEV